MKVRRALVWALAIAILGIHVFAALQFASDMASQKARFLWNPLTSQFLAQGLFFAGVLILLEGILTSLRREG